LFLERSGSKEYFQIPEDKKTLLPSAICTKGRVFFVRSACESSMHITQFIFDKKQDAKIKTSLSTDVISRF